MNSGIKTFDGGAIASPLLWAYSLGPHNVIVRRDSGVTSITDLAGQRFGPGRRGSSSEATSQEVLAVFGVEPEWARGSNGELASAIKDNRANGFIKSAIGTKFDALTTNIETFAPVQVLPVPDGKINIIRDQLPVLSIVDMPGSDMENTGAYQTWCFMIGVSARPDLDEHMAYDIVNTVMEDGAERRFRRRE